ncbi:MAG TPA: hypothetical protein VLA23_00820 [Candidatus Limnocylindrales bacterium]|nr:hypothetical protein [Candidatus Limnocylindrales bacterium]
MNSVARPTGITILAILALIGGIFGALAGLALLFGGALIGGAIGGAEGAAFGGLAFILGLITLAGAGLYLAFAYGSWTAKTYGWALGIIGALWSIVTQAITVLLSGDIVGTLISFSTIVSLAIPIIILYYLNTPNVKAYFGRA